MSQVGPNGYVSALYPNTGGLQETVLPNIHVTSMGGNSAAYNSNQVGGGRRRKSRKSRKSRRRRGGGCGCSKR